MTCTTPKQTVGKSSGRSPDIKAGKPLRINTEGIQGFLEFETSPAYIGSFSFDVEKNALFYRLTRKAQPSVVCGDVTRKDRAQCRLCIGKQALTHELSIKAALGSALYHLGLSALRHRLRRISYRLRRIGYHRLRRLIIMSISMRIFKTCFFLSGKLRGIDHVYCF